MKTYLLAQPFRHNTRPLKPDTANVLLEICRALLSDGQVQPAEAVYLRQWIATNAQDASEWPFCDIVARLKVIFSDGVATPEECEELAGILRGLAEIKPAQTDPRLAGYGQPAPAAGVFDDPAPVILHDEKAYCITGSFAFGSRSAVQAAIVDRGGSIHAQPRTDTDFVLVGSFVSPAWKRGVWGNKIERAIGFRQSGHPIAIISETDWKTYL